MNYKVIFKNTIDLFIAKVWTDEREDTTLSNISSPSIQNITTEFKNVMFQNNIINTFYIFINFSIVH
jgi:hypothetical protein